MTPLLLHKLKKVLRNLYYWLNCKKFTFPFLTKYYKYKSRSSFLAWFHKNFLVVLFSSIQSHTYVLMFFVTTWLTHIEPMFPFGTPWKHQETLAQYGLKNFSIFLAFPTILYPCRHIWAGSTESETGGACALKCLGDGPMGRIFLGRETTTTQWLSQNYL